MPDITMCDNQKCENKARCYRFMADRSDYQSYAIFNEGMNEICEYFVQLKRHHRKADKAVDW